MGKTRKQRARSFSKQLSKRPEALKTRRVTLTVVHSEEEGKSGAMGLSPLRERVSFSGCLLAVEEKQSAESDSVQPRTCRAPRVETPAPHADGGAPGPGEAIKKPSTKTPAVAT